VTLKVLYAEQGEFLGGGELFSIDVLGELRRRRDVEIVVATSDPSSSFGRRIRAIGWPVIPLSLPALPRRPWLAAASAGSLARAIREQAPDVVHTNTLRGHLIGSAVRAHQSTPLTWMLHDFNFQPALLRLASRAPAAIAALPAVADWAGRTAPRCRGKLTEMVNGLDHDRLASIRPVRFHEDSGAAADGVLDVGFVGAIAPWKGVRHVVLAARDLLDRGVRARFHVVGPTHPRDRSYERQLRRLAGGAPIQWLGWREDAEAVIAGLDVLIHASLAPEPFGRVVLEAMALGTPVIATNHGGPAGIVTHGVDGLLVPPGDTAALVRALEQLCGDEPLRLRLAEAGRETARQRYRLADVADGMAALWRGAAR